MTDYQEGSVTYSIGVEDSDAARKLDELGGKADLTNRKLDDTEAKQDSVRIKSIQTMTALQGVVSGLSATTSAMDTLQIGSEELRTSIKQVAADIQLFVGIAQTIKGAVILIETLNSALKMTAVMSTFAWAAANPAASLLVVGAVGAAGGYVISQITNVSNSTTYNSSTQDTRQASSVLNAAAWYA